jgi:regulator of RNase E activity RraA
MGESKKLTKRPKKEIIDGFMKVSTCNVSDALDKLDLPCGIFGIKPTYDCPKVVGTAITMRVVPYGPNNPEGHMGVDPLSVAESGDIIVIDNSGRIDQNCWGEILTYSALQLGVAGAIIDGATRDVDIIKETGFPVYARGIVPHTARGRNVQGDYNCLVQIGGVQVSPGDLIMADVNGVVVIPQDRAEEVLAVSLELFHRELDIVEQIKSGQSFLEVDKKSGYDKMLQEK